MLDLFFSVVAYGFDGAGFEYAVAEYELLLCFRLTDNVGVGFIFFSGKELRRTLSAEVTVYAVAIHVVAASGVVLVFLCGLCHAYCSVPTSTVMRGVKIFLL